MRKTARKCFVSAILAVSLVFPGFGTAGIGKIVSADDTKTPRITISNQTIREGENTLSSDGSSGKVFYDADNDQLTFENVKAKNVLLLGTSPDMTVYLKGTNRLSGGQYGINSSYGLMIESEKGATLDIDIQAPSENDMAIGLKSTYLLKIKNSNIKIKGIGKNTGGVQCYGGSESRTSLLSVENSSVDMENITSQGLFCYDSVKLSNSSVSGESKEGNMVQAMNGDVTIDGGSRLNANAAYTSVYARNDMIISDSTVNASSVKATGISAGRDLMISGNSEIEGRGDGYGVYAKGPVTMDGGSLKAVSANNMGIYTEGTFYMNSGEVYAKGGKYAALAARAEKQPGNEKLSSHIVLGKDYAEASGGKISVSDWDADDYSWTSFISSQELKLASDRSNALMEVTIKKKEEDKNEEDKKTDIKVSKLTLNAETKMVKKGKTYQLKAFLSPSNATNKKIVWKSSNPKSVTVDSRGKVKAKSYGRSVITASAADGSGKTAACTVTVPYTIKYKLNKGKNSRKNPTVFYDQKVVFKKPARKGYIFSGWYKNKNFKTKITKIKKGSKKNYTVYAKWKKVKVTPTYLTGLRNLQSRKVRLTFAKADGAKGYQIKYAANKKYKKAKYKFVKNRTVTLKELKKGKKYYFKVRAYKLDSAGKRVYSKYSRQMVWEVW